MSKDRLSVFALFLLIMITVVMLGQQLIGYELISIAVFFFVLLKFIFDLGSKISIKNIICLLMALQWLLGPVLGYLFNDYILINYRMAVDKIVYFGYVLPATVAFIVGIYLKLNKTPYKPNFSPNVNYYQKGIMLILIGFVFEYLPGAGFIGYLLAALKYVGAFYMILTPHKNKYYWIALVFGYLFFLRSLVSGGFHELLLWSCFLLILNFYFNHKSFLFRFSLIFIGFFFVFILQLVKPSYRSQISENSSESKTTIFFKLVSDKLFGNDPLFSNEDISYNVIRINQGWIISNVMNYVPTQQPFANGKTVQDAIIASIFPRFLFPNKAIAGGHLNMEKYAGITLNESTSMDISQVGEAYANFGVMGGILMMFILGLFSNMVITFVEKKCLHHPELILWLPLLYLQVVKAETSLVTVLNHLVKASIVTWFFFSPWGYKVLSYKFGRWKFGVRTFRLSSAPEGMRGLRLRKGPKRRKSNPVFEDRVRKPL